MCISHKTPRISTERIKRGIVMTIRTPGFEPAAQYSQRSPALRDVLESPQLPTAAQGEKRKDIHVCSASFCDYTIL